MKIKCPQCGFRRSVPNKSLPDKPRFKALCPKCGERFSVALQSNTSSARFDLKSLSSKKTKGLTITILLAVVALSAFSLGRQTSSEETVVVTKPAAEVARIIAEKPVELEEQVKDEPQSVALQCSGEEKIVDYSPSTPGLGEDPWEAGPWQFNEIFRLALGKQTPGIELFLGSRDEFVELACRNAEGYCSVQCEADKLAVKFSMQLGLDNNSYARELTINRTDGAFHHAVTMSGGRLRNTRTQTGVCQVIDTGATSF